MQCAGPAVVVAALSPIRMLYVVAKSCKFCPREDMDTGIVFLSCSRAGKYAQTALIASVLHLVNSYGVAVAALAWN